MVCVKEECCCGGVCFVSRAFFFFVEEIIQIGMGIGRGDGMPCKQHLTANIFFHSGAAETHQYLSYKRIGNEQGRACISIPYSS